MSSITSAAISLVAGAATFVGTMAIADVDQSYAALASIGVASATYAVLNRSKPEVAVEAAPKKKDKKKVLYHTSWSLALTVAPAVRFEG